MGLYIECDTQKAGVSKVGDTGYGASAYGITDVLSSSKRYMGPLHIKVYQEKCGWDTAMGETKNEIVSLIQPEIDIILE